MANYEDKPFPEAQPPRRFISLRWLATLAAAGLVAVTVATVGWVSEKNMRRALVREAQTQLVLEARNLAITSRDALLTEFPELTLIPMAKDIQNGRPEILDVVITNHQGLIQGSPESRATGTTWIKPPGMVEVRPSTKLEKDEKLSESHSMIMVESPVHLNKDQDIGWVVIVLDKHFIDTKLQNARATLLKFALGLLGIAVLLSAVLMSNLFKPLSQLREGLQRIGQGDLDSPMHVRDFTELGLLGDTVNSMSGQLKASQNLAKAREQEIIDTQKEVIITLGQVVEGRSSETANHTLRVGDMSYQLALLAGLPDQEAELIRMASPMHDVGKIGIPDSILNKPGKLTAEEYSTMQNHSEIGYTILNKSERSVLKAAATIAHEHHERWDGKGYPRKVKGEDIHVYGRIVSLVDVFDAIFSDRVYRKAMPLEKVLGIIKEEKGQSFEPRLVDLFLANLPRFLAITERYQDQMVGDPKESTTEKTARVSDTVPTA
jgi:response regulator RpfG family c-di-GMP phosphodiesterase